MTWDPLYTWPVYAGTIVAVMAAVLLARRSAMSPSLRSVWLYVPRLLAIGFLIYILLNPVRESDRRLPPRRPQVSVLIDASRSMGLDRPVTRIEQVKEAVFEAQSELDSRQGAELQLYRFGSHLSSIPSLAEMRADHEQSQLDQGLKDLVGLFQQAAPKALIVFSDGTLLNRPALNRIAADYAKLGVPVHVYPVGAKGIRGDVAIASLTVPKGSQPGDRVPIQFVVRSQGFGGDRVVVQVRPEKSVDGQPLAELPITLDGTPQPFELVVPVDPKAGNLVLSVPVQQGEAIESNNSVPFELIARDRRLRVFYMEGTIIRTQYRRLTQALREDPNIECVPVTVNSQFAQRPRLQRISDPLRGFPATREELFEYDVVICSDISRGAFTPEQLAWTVELVKDRGGGFAMIGGHTSFGAGNWDQTAWDQLIPIDMQGGRLGQGFVTRTIQVDVPDEAKGHPIWHIVDDSRRNEQILAAMPQFNGTNVARRLKPGATLLGESSRRLSMAGRSPIFACQSYGRGRTFAMMTDSTYWWGERFETVWGINDNRYFRRFWRNTVNWLSENSLTGRRRLLVETDKLIYRPGEPIELQISAFDADFNATTGYRIEAEVLNSADESAGRVLCDPDVQTESYSGKIVAALPRPSTDEESSTLTKAVLRVSAWNGADQIEHQDTELQVLSDSDELLSPSPEHDTLERLASATGGEVLTSADQIADVLGDLPVIEGERVVHRAPVWDHPWVWAAILSLLSLEWILRRRLGFGRSSTTQRKIHSRADALPR